MKKLCRVLRSKDGLTMIEPIVGALIMLTVLVSCISILSFFVAYVKVEYICSKMVRSIEVSGLVDAETYSQFDALKTASSRNPTMEITATYCDALNTKIQLRQHFQVKMTDNYTFKIFEPAGSDAIGITVPITIELMGIGEKYWKTE